MIHHAKRFVQFGLVLARGDLSCLKAWSTIGPVAWRLIGAKYLGVITALFTGNRRAGSVPLAGRRFHYDQLTSLLLLPNTFTENAYLKGVLPRGCVVVDIGANIGQFRWFCESVLGAGRVLSVEPVSNTFEVLRRNFDRDVWRLAAGSAEQVVLHVDRDCSARASATDDQRPSYSETVPGRRLDDIDAIRQVPSIDLLKVDTEGAELDVLQSGLATVRRSAFLLLELSVSRESRGDMAATLAWLHREAPEFEVVHIGHVFEDNGRTVAVDCLLANRTRTRRPERVGQPWDLVSRAA